MKRLLHNIIKKILLYLYGRDGLILYYTGELGEIADIDYFNNGEVFGGLEIIPFEEGYDLTLYSREEMGITK